MVDEVGRTGETYVGHLIKTEEGSNSGLRSGFIIIAIPEFDAKARSSGVVLVGLSLPNIVNRYIETAKYDLQTDAWVVDDNGTILYHPDPSLIGQDASVLEMPAGRPVALKMLMLRLSAGNGTFQLNDKGRPEKKLVAYAPIHLNVRQWSLAAQYPMLGNLLPETNFLHDHAGSVFPDRSGARRQFHHDPFGQGSHTS